MSPVLLSRVSGGQGVASLASFKRNLGSSVGERLYVEDVFSVDLYEGTGSLETITNGIDLSGEGGLVIHKNRDQNNDFIWTDSIRGDYQRLVSSVTNSTIVSQDDTNYGTAFTSTGFTTGKVGTSSPIYNASGNKFASWTFRKAPGFFDVVTYTGNDYVAQNIPHNLGCVPGCIIIKCTNASGYNWRVYHRSTGATIGLQLDDTSGGVSNSAFWNNTAPTSTEFTVGTLGDVNGMASQTYVAYLFAHDEQIFGDNADQSIIQCGSYTGNASTSNVVNLGWEPQWLLIKRSDNSGQDWHLFDTSREMAGTGIARLYPNKVNSEEPISGPTGVGILPLSTGFEITADGTDWNGSGYTYVYIAIRRGPMKTPESATDVFDIVARYGSGATTVPLNISPDLSFVRRRSGTNNVIVDRLRGNFNIMFANYPNSEGDNTNFVALAGQTKNNGFYVGTDLDVNGSASYQYINYFFKRAPGFFDMVAYTGDGVSNRSVPHNLGVVPELYINKRRDSTGNWNVYSSAGGAGKYLIWENNQAFGTYPYFGTPTADNIVLNNAAAGTANGLNEDYITYLFASCPGVSKVGSYTGTGTTLNIDCGFTSGARFVMVKRTDDTGNWFIWDTARGIVAGDDPYILVNSDSPSSVSEVINTDFIDPYSAGFTMTGQAPNYYGNVSGGSYIFLAIA